MLGGCPADLAGDTSAKASAMPTAATELALGSTEERRRRVEKTYELRLFHHRRKNKLRAPDALVEGAPMQLRPLSAILCHSIALRCPALRPVCRSRHSRKISSRSSEDRRGGECAPKSS
jgi:hypothetical protein